MHITAEYDGITPPDSSNISVGEYAVFTCKFNFSLTYVAWYLDFTPVQYYTDVYAIETLCIDCASITSTIEILAQSEYAELLDNNTVRCQAINTEVGLFRFSLPATLRVQGEKGGEARKRGERGMRGREEDRGRGGQKGRK